MTIIMNEGEILELGSPKMIDGVKVYVILFAFVWRETESRLQEQVDNAFGQESAQLAHAGQLCLMQLPEIIADWQ